MFFIKDLHQSPRKVLVKVRRPQSPNQSPNQQSPWVLHLLSLGPRNGSLWTRRLKKWVTTVELLMVFYWFILLIVYYWFILWIVFYWFILLIVYYWFILCSWEKVSNYSRAIDWQTDEHETNFDSLKPIFIILHAYHQLIFPYNCSISSNWPRCLLNTGRL